MWTTIFCISTSTNQHKNHLYSEKTRSVYTQCQRNKVESKLKPGDKSDDTLLKDAYLRKFPSVDEGCYYIQHNASTCTLFGVLNNMLDHWSVFWNLVFNKEFIEVIEPCYNCWSSYSIRLLGISIIIKMIGTNKWMFQKT